MRRSFWLGLTGAAYSRARTSITFTASSTPQQLFSTAVFEFLAAATGARFITPDFLFHDRRFLRMEQPLQIANILSLVWLDADATFPTMLFEGRTHFLEARLRLNPDNRRILFTAQFGGFLHAKGVYPTVRVDTAAHRSNISDSITHSVIISVIGPLSYIRRALAARSGELVLSTNNRKPT
jgi:hypothetical protein